MVALQPSIAAQPVSPDLTSWRRACSGVIGKGGMQILVDDPSGDPRTVRNRLTGGISRHDKAARKKDRANEMADVTISEMAWLFHAIFVSENLFLIGPAALYFQSVDTRECRHRRRHVHSRRSTHCGAE